MAAKAQHTDDARELEAMDENASMDEVRRNSGAASDSAPGAESNLSDAAAQAPSAIGEPRAAANQYRQTADAHVQTLKDFWKNFLISGLFVVAAVVIIFACLAWFLNNSQVKATGASVSAKSADFTLMVADEVENDQNAKIGMYENGSTTNPKHSLSTVDAMLVNSDSNFNNNQGGTSAELGPGSAGKLQLKIHRYNKDLKNFTVTISFDKSAIAGNDDKTKALLNGHIQFFTAQSDAGYYSGLLLPNKNGERTLEVNFTDNTSDDQAFTVYWVWPERLRTIIAPGGNRYEQGLFLSGEGNSDYTSLLNDLSKNKPRYFNDTSEIPNDISNSMSNANYVTCSNEYDAADDYIGSNVRYVQLHFEAAKVDPGNGGE